MKSSPDKVYIFAITSLSIWNAGAVGVTKQFIFDTLNKYSKFEVPEKITEQITLWYNSYGQVSLEKQDDASILLKVEDEIIKEKIRSSKTLQKFISSETDKGFIVNYFFRGEIKAALISCDIPVKDNLPFHKGEELPFSINKYIAGTQNEIVIRDYQEDSAESVYQAGHGTVVLPCGSGKTIVGLRLMELCQTSTLIVTNSSSSVKQWYKTILAFTNIPKDKVAMYNDKNKEIKQITITTYNMISYKYKGEFIHFKKFSLQNIGLCIYDEVHLMPAAMFRIVASLQSVKRLALTATFIREDGKEIDIFTLIGPKRYDKPWKDLEARGYIASISLKEIRVSLSNKDNAAYTSASNAQKKFEIAATAENKTKIVKALLEKHKDDKVLIIGQFTDHLISLAQELNLPCVYGDTPEEKREELYNKMRNNEVNVIVASRIANAALDIPNISVVIQVSFLYGSRNEEAQRVGRATRPKEKSAYFYTIISKDTKEEDYNFNRQMFLTNEGYKYEILDMAA